MEILFPSDLLILGSCGLMLKFCFEVHGKKFSWLIGGCRFVSSMGSDEYGILGANGGSASKTPLAELPTLAHTGEREGLTLS